MSKFKIYNASAGAGKTYTLVKEFLRICLKGENANQYRQILAITFTNKAANEMKERIVQKLETFANEQESIQDPMFFQLAEELQVPHIRLSYAAQAALKSILHNYSAFSVSTIDKFTNRLIRSFSQDLKLSSNYEVELDTDELLREAVDRMLADLMEGDATSKVLLEFINDKLSEGKSPRPEQSLLAMGKNLFDEAAYPYLKHLKGFGKEEIMKAAGKLRKEKKDWEDKWSDEALEMMTLIHSQGIERMDFSSGTVYNYILNFVERDSSKWPINKTLEKVVFDGAPFYAKTKAKNLAPKFNPIEDELRTRLEKLVKEVVEVFPRYHLITKILKDVYSLAVLAEIDKNLQEVKEEENKLPIGEFNKLISDKLENEPTAYLFEKLGDRYQYFFIDEFQDTSVLQWRNLLPLINNALSANGSAMIVGDAKQSIYRWRGGEVGQFIDLSNDVDPSNKVLLNGEEMELYSRETLNLGSNYRSRKNVVEFNNDFFTNSADLMQEEVFKDIYAASNQNVERQDGGYVCLKQIEYDKETYEQQQCEESLAVIQDAISRGYTLSDITIITRKKDYLAALAEFLLDKGIKVISPDSLLLEQSQEVRSLVSFLKFLCRPDDFASRWDFLSSLWALDVIKEKYKEEHRFISSHVKSNPVELNSALSGIIPNYSYPELLQQGLLDKVYLLARWFKLDVQGNPFLHTFVDKVSDFQNNKKGGEAEFCRHWDDKGSRQSIALPDGVDAVNLMTVHKSKGLEFPITIVPFADWLSTREPNGSSAWMNLESHDMAGLPVARVSLSENANAHEDYQNLHLRNKGLVYLDNLNLAYVAFTRAVDELYVFGSKGKPKESSNLTIYISQYFRNKGVEGLMLEVGERGQKRQEDVKDNALMWKNYEAVSWQDRLRITIDAPLDWNAGESEGTSYGKKVHGVFAKLDGKASVEEIIDNEVILGRLTNEESEPLKTLIDSVLANPEVMPYFAEGVGVLNEKDILLPKKGSLRPDRLSVVDGVVHIIDYKTGVSDPNHQKQLDAYSDVLLEMGFKVGDKVLIYLNENPEVVKW
ncbi:UvrD-helicase domain-containing protein [Owenweeksia hongkongensis]|uniref:UvrD-helicase domain-containing protein n=1 Tax=Owenweeksia hongkongensis TaxID=253245 RepID=UPI003A94F28F